MPPKPPARRPPTRRTANPSAENEGGEPSASTEATTESTPSTTTSRAPTRAGTAGSPPRPTPSSSSTTRPPVQRLQSLKKRNPGGTLIPPNRDGSTPKPTLKYQPKAVQRRSKSEREAREKLEDERHQERLAEAAAVRRASERGRERGRGRGRGAFGRGGMIYGGGLDGPSRGASDRTRGGWGGGGGGGGGGGRVKGEYGGAGGRRTARPSVMLGRDGDVSSDEGDDTGPRVSIENINVISDSEDESDEPYDGKGKGKGKAKQRAGTSENGRGLRPVRVERHEHVERVVAVTTEADQNKSAELRRKAQEAAADDDGDLFVRDEEEPAAQAEGGTQSTEPQVKEEPTDGDVLMTDDIPPAQDDEGPVATKRPKAKPQKKAVPKNQRRNGEDDVEWEIQQNEVEMLKQTLGSIDLHPKPAADEEGQEAKAETDAPLNPRDGRLFLIQFPPKTPNLVIPKDPTLEDELEAPAQPTAASPPPLRGIGIKKEGSSTDTPVPIPSGEEKPPDYVTAKNNNLPAGRVGKLNVHKSGRVTLDWGGIPFELNMGTEVNFLQDAVVTSSPSTDLTGEEAEEKKVWAMSQVTGKFVVTPDWDKLLGE
ncbi:hypothetical protein FQN54_003229 [Arachnomyces sp. PD_36]|nr:hypothetical protein FQN54_003229 [Arachnomyces sp. PD_36]